MNLLTLLTRNFNVESPHIATLTVDCSQKEHDVNETTLRQQARFRHYRYQRSKFKLNGIFCKAADLPASFRRFSMKQLDSAIMKKHLRLTFRCKLVSHGLRRLLDPLFRVSHERLVRLILLKLPIYHQSLSWEYLFCSKTLCFI